MTWQYVPWVFFWVHPRFNPREDSNLEKTIKVDQKNSKENLLFQTKGLERAQPNRQKTSDNDHSTPNTTGKTKPPCKQKPTRLPRLPSLHRQMEALLPQTPGVVSEKRTFIATHSNKFQPLQLSHMGKWGSLLYTNVIPSNQAAYWPIENGILINDSSLTPDCRVEHP